MLSDIGLIILINLPPVFLMGLLVYLFANWTLQDGRRRHEENKDA